MLHVAKDAIEEPWQRAAFTAFASGVLEGMGSTTYSAFLEKLGLLQRDVKADREKAMRNAVRVAKAFQKRPSAHTR